MEQKLEQMLVNAPKMSTTKEYQTIDVFAAGTAAVFTPPIRIYDMPSGGMSLHIHGSNDGNYLYGGSIKEFGTNNVLRTLNGYECSMLDNLYGHELGIKSRI